MMYSNSVWSKFLPTFKQPFIQPPYRIAFLNTLYFITQYVFIVAFLGLIKSAECYMTFALCSTWTNIRQAPLGHSFRTCPHKTHLKPIEVKNHHMSAPDTLSGGIRHWTLVCSSTDLTRHQTSTCFSDVSQLTLITCFLDPIWKPNFKVQCRHTLRCKYQLVSTIESTDQQFTSPVTLNSWYLLVRLRSAATAVIQLGGRDVTVRSPLSDFPPPSGPVSDRRPEAPPRTVRDLPCPPQNTAVVSVSIS